MPCVVYLYIYYLTLPIYLPPKVEIKKLIDLNLGGTKVIYQRPPRPGISLVSCNVWSVGSAGVTAVCIPRAPIPDTVPLVSRVPLEPVACKFNSTVPRRIGSHDYYVNLAFNQRWGELSRGDGGCPAVKLVSQRRKTKAWYLLSIESIAYILCVVGNSFETENQNLMNKSADNTQCQYIMR